MHLTTLAASGATGLALTRQALERGHTVRAVARTPARISVPDSPGLTKIAADVRNAEEIATALEAGEAVLSGLGVVKGEGPGALTAGARATVVASPGRIVWLGAYGTGPSAKAAGPATRLLLKGLGAKIADKVTSDAIVLDAGGTVLHAGPLSDKPLSRTRRTVGLEAAPKRFFPAFVSRQTVAAAMLDEVEEPRFAGGIALPLTR